MDTQQELERAGYTFERAVTDKGVQYWWNFGVYTSIDNFPTLDQAVEDAARDAVIYGRDHSPWW